MSDDADSILDNDLEPLKPEQDTYDASAEEAALDQAQTNTAMAEELAELRQRIHEVEALVLLPAKFPTPFVAAVGTDGSFQELCILNGSVSAFADGRAGTATSLAAGQSWLLEARDDPAMRFVALPTTSNGTGVNVTVVTSITASGANATVNSQALTVLAAGTTSSSTITFPTGTGSSAATGALLFAKTDPAFAGDSVNIPSPAGGSSAFGTSVPGNIMVTSDSGGIYDPTTVIGNLFSLDVAGWGQLTNLGESDNYFIFTVLASGIVGGGTVLAKMATPIPATVGSGVFRWSMAVKLTMTGPSATASATGGLVSVLGTLSGPSLTLTALSGAMAFSLGAAGFEDGGGTAGPITPAFIALGTISFNATLSSIAHDAGGDLSLGPVTLKWDGPALFNSYS